MEDTMINRLLQQQILSLLHKGIAIVIMGARQVGKSTLMQQVLNGRDDVLWLNGDEPDTQSVFEQLTSSRARAIIGNKQIIVIDEAQRISNIGLKLKLITDQIPQVQLIATGSSSFSLASQINEPLTGRKREFRMFPLSFMEMVNHTSLIEEQRLIAHRMVYGYYPEVVNNSGDEKIVLKELSDSYLYRDILSLDKVTKSDKLISLLRALALQIGSQVSYNELANLVGIDAKTVERYIDILEKTYIIFRLGSFARNLRNELKFSRKIYFWDLGIRNAILGSFSPIENRTDTGALWENFAIVERLKRNAYQMSFAQSYFWRTKQQKEIDYIEEEDGQISAFEFKWNDNKQNTKCPESFVQSYPNAQWQVITPNTLYEWVNE